MTGLLCLQEHKYCINPVNQKLWIIFFAFAFICPLPGHNLCMLPHFNKHKYLEKDTVQNEWEMKEFVESWKLQIFISVTSAYSWVFIGKLAPSLAIATPGSQWVWALLAPLGALCALHVVLQPLDHEGKNYSLSMTWLPSTKPCHILRREHPRCSKPIALHEKSDRNQKCIIITVYQATHWSLKSSYQGTSKPNPSLLWELCHLLFL